ncbi:MAG: TolC family outer membrane protein [Acetobacter sp.]|nr:TolC family outer membrane protein [Acetobacter sp.]
MRHVWFAGVGLSTILSCSTALAQKYDGSGSPTFIPHTLQEALSSAYLTNPTLLQERATLRATDEQVPTALAGWHPKITGTFAPSYYKGESNYFGSTDGGGGGYNRKYNTFGYSSMATVQQPIWTGGKTTASTHQAVNRVMAERAHLISVEQQVFSDVVSAYVSVVQDEQLLAIGINNQHVLEQQFKATKIRFRDGELTRTDVAQAETSLASAIASRRQAEGNLQAAQATYMQVVGIAPPPNLEPPQPLQLPVNSETEAVHMAVDNNPDVIAALFAEASQKDAVAVAMAALMPSITANLAYSHAKNQQLDNQLNDNKYATLNINVPIYQGGSEYAGVRQAKQQTQAAHRAVDVQRRSAAQAAASNWQKLLSYKAAISSDRIAIKAGYIALDGVQRQAIVGTSSTLEVLQQQSTLLSAQTALVQDLGNMVTTSYGVASAIGRLTARDLHLRVPLYDEKAYYNAVKDRLWGINDYATNEPGR